MTLLKGRFARRVYMSMINAGLDPRKTWRTITSTPGYFNDARAYEARLQPSSYSFKHFPLTRGNLFPYLGDKYEQAGQASGHYFHQDIWAARKIFQRNPKTHLDIGSSLEGFIAHLLVFRSVTVIDIRALKSNVEGLTFIQDDATNLQTIQSNSCGSISSLHAVEHFGLGRYGDPIDPDGWHKAMRALARVVAVGGRLYFSVPIGRERVEFNGHRIFAPATVLEAFSDLRLLEFSAVGDDGNFRPNQDPAAFGTAVYSCGLFEFTKDAPATV